MTANEIQVLQLRQENPELRVLICDDDPQFLQRLRDKAAEILEKLSVKAVFHAFSDCRDISEEQLARCDVALLDIDLNTAGCSGIGIARALRRVNSRALIIFVTNFIEYAPEGYEVQAFRYILKRDMEQLLGRYLMQALDQLSEARNALQLQCRGELIELPFDQILYLEVLQHNVSVFVRAGDAAEVYTVSATLSSFEQQLENHGFLRVHKSYLVNMRRIRKFQCGTLTLDDGTVIRTSEKNYAEQKRKYLLWKGWQ